MNSTYEHVPMIIPTVMIPLTLISVGISVVASFIASLFGIKLKTEGPKKLLEVFLKPKIILTLIIFNIFTFACVKGYLWWKNYPKLISTIERESKRLALPSEKNYTNNALDTKSFQRQNLRKAPLMPVTQNWIHESKSPVFSEALISSNSIFIGTRKGIIQELDLETGKEIRKFYVGSPVTGKLTLWNNFLFAGEGVHDLHHARIYKFDLKSGAFIGAYQSKGHIEAKSIIATHENQNLLFVPSGEDGLHAVDPNNMKKVWHAYHGHTDASVAANDGLVFMATGREKDDDKRNKSFAVALNFKSGELAWKRELSASSWMTPSLHESNVCFVTGELYFETKRGQVLCFDQKTGKDTLAYNFEQPIISMPLILDDSLIVSTETGFICKLNLLSSEKKWCQDVKSEGNGFAGPHYDPYRDLIVYPSSDKGIFALNPDNGEMILNWKASPEEKEWNNTFADVAITEKQWIISDYKSYTRSLLLEAKANLKLRADANAPETNP